MIKCNVRLRAGALAAAERKGATVARIVGAVSVPEALALVREQLPPTEEGQGWALYVPAGVVIGCTCAVDVHVGRDTVKAGEQLALNFAWLTPSRRVLLRCAASATRGGRRDVVWPVDFYEEQLATIGTLSGVPFRYEGWQLVNQDRLQALADGTGRSR